MRNLGLMQTIRFVAFGFITDKLCESIMFGAIRSANIFIADLVHDIVTGRSIVNSYKGNNFPANTVQCEKHEEYSLSDYLEHHAYEVADGFAIRASADAVISLLPNAFLERVPLHRVLEFFSTSPFELAEHFNLGPPDFMQPYYDAIYEKPHTVMHMVEAILMPYYNVLFKGEPAACEYAETFASVWDDFLFAADYYNMPLQFVKNKFEDQGMLYQDILVTNHTDHWIDDEL